MAKHIIRLTEGELKNIIKKTLNEMINEDYMNKQGHVLIDTILEDYKADEIAKDLGLDSADDAAAHYFSEIASDAETTTVQSIPKYTKFISHISSINGDLYYDYGANYYFVALS